MWPDFGDRYDEEFELDFDADRRAHERRVVLSCLGLLLVLAIFLGIMAVTMVLQEDAHAAPAERPVMVCKQTSCEWIEPIRRPL